MMERMILELCFMCDAGPAGRGRGLAAIAGLLLMESEGPRAQELARISAACGHPPAFPV